MRVLQLIDSLQVGGAEQMAVNYANLLAEQIDASYLCATRIEGALKVKISKNVGYLFLNKRRALDIKAIRKLNRFVKKNNIEVIHAHGTSFFLATLIKLYNKKIKLVWHDHNGNRVLANKYQNLVLKYCSYYFYKIITVNIKLKSWSEEHMKAQDVLYLPNFSILEKQKPVTFLKGIEGKRIVCLANLRHPKNHMFLLKAFINVSHLHKDWSLHLIGQDHNDLYALQIKEYIKENDLCEKVYLYGLQPDIKNILLQSDIGVLPSSSEGLPLSLLEYGMAKLAVVSTKVGDCDKVITRQEEGRLIDSNDVYTFSEALLTYINNKNLRIESGEMLYKSVFTNFNAQKILLKLVSIYTD